ncbi:MAG: DUF86 domain-containing protein [Chloroflexi bacterium]|nr:DUF86 domain-containing protein [Chloroflexota bacterium]
MPVTRKAIAAQPSLPTILEKLTPVIPDLRRRFGIKRLGLFGSYVRGDQNARSDLDVLVEFTGPPDLSYFEIQEELEGLLGLKVDVVPRDGLKPYIGRRILAEVVWLEENAGGKRALSVIRERPVPARRDHEIRDFLNDILENVAAVNEFIADGDFDRLLSDRQYQYAVLYALFIIGEATTRIPAPFRQKRPEIPWRRIVGLRNVVAHNYPGLNLERIWKIASHELESLSVAVSEILAEIERQESKS